MLGTINFIVDLTVAAGTVVMMLVTAAVEWRRKPYTRQEFSRAMERICRGVEELWRAQDEVMFVGPEALATNTRTPGTPGTDGTFSHAKALTSPVTRGGEAADLGLREATAEQVPHPLRLAEARLRGFGMMCRKGGQSGIDGTFSHRSASSSTGLTVNTR